MSGGIQWHIMRPSPLRIALPLFAAGLPSGHLRAAEPAADEMFGHEIQPIFQAHCVKCHGDGKLKGGLDLTTFARALKGGSSGPVIVPGKSSESLLVEQLVEKSMPPEDEPPLPEAARRKIVEWIERAKFPEQGALQTEAEKSVHDRAKTLWSFHAPVRPPVPEVKDALRARTPIDRFVLQKLEAAGRTLSADASRRTLIRRVTFDLIGLPPTPEEIEAFANDQAPDAYERLIERLLASPRYGERWGRHWLDVAGWSESTLLIGDFVRTGFWRYRDWVVKAFNEDKPYDQFVREQLAGDELVNWRDEDVFDQDTIDKLTATGFMRCAPDGTDNQLITQEEKRFVTQQTAVEVAVKALMGVTLNCVRCHDHKYDPITQREYYSTVAVFEPAFDLEKWIPGMTNTFGAGPVRVIPIADRKGRESHARRLEQLAEENAELSYQRDNGIPNRYRDRYIEEHRTAWPAELDKTLLEAALKKEERQRSAEEKAVVWAAAKHFALGPEKIKSTYPQVSVEQKENLKEQKEVARKGSDIGEVIVGLWDVSTQPSPTRMLGRGDFKNPGAKVEPGVLATLDRAGQPWQPPKQGPNPHTTGRRLAYADWVVRPDHPLTARVMVNRIWQYHFGTGIVATADDFGLRGAKPTHPKLLDWLATEFVRTGWSVKAMHRLILLSSTYRQMAPVRGETDDMSPTLLAAFPRRRLEAEAIRDSMLNGAGLLDLSMGGESIQAEQDESGAYDVPAEHPGRYRRSIYLSTRRTQVPTLLALFDAPSMDTNWPKRNDSAVAPQALVLSNHPLVIECADAFGRRAMALAASNQERLRWIFATAFGRRPTAEEEGDFAPLLDEIAEATGSDDAQRRWRTIAHALIGANEFLYID